MEVEFCDDGSVKLSQVDYIKEAIADFGEDLGQKAPNPASKTMFNVDLSATKLSEQKRQNLYSIVQKLLWVTERSRPDVMVLIAFLTKRVTKASRLGETPKGSLPLKCNDAYAFNT